MRSCRSPRTSLRRTASSRLSDRALRGPNSLLAGSRRRRLHWSLLCHPVVGTWVAYYPALEDEILPQPAHFLEAYRKLAKV